MAQLQLRLRSLRSVFTLLLIASTWRLWGSTAGGTFPVIPFFEWLTGVPFVVDLILSAVLVLALLLDLGLSVQRLRNRDAAGPTWAAMLAGIGILSSGTLLVALNQQRLQPWMYHFLLLTPILALPTAKQDSPVRSRWRPSWSLPALMIALTASIYAWSAWSKLDVSFVRDHGSAFVEALAGVFGLSTRFWTPGMRSTSAGLLPAGELFVAIALIIPRSRRFGLVVSIVMHGLLILTVGPWAMDQRPGVVLWNVYFMAQNGVLAVFVKSKAESSSATVGQTPRSDRMCVAITLFTLSACLAPALRVFDRFDNWPSWAVYAASTRHVRVLIEPDALRSAPRELRDCIEQRRLQDGSAWLRIDQWALSEFNAPIYPQDRLQVGVALAVSKRFQLGDSIQVVVEGRANRFSGKRTVDVYAGHAAIEELVAGYRLNTTVRAD